MPSHALRGWIARVGALFVASLLWASPSWAGGESVPTSSADLDAYRVDGELLVDLDDDVDDSAAAALFAKLAVGFTPTALAADTRAHVVRAAPARLEALRRALEGDSRVEIVEPHMRVRALFAPNDPLLAEQWHMKRVGADRAWDFSTGRGVTVAVIDTGIACEDFDPFTKASDLAQTQCVPGYDFVRKNSHASDDHGHGTHVAGTIAQSTNNALGAAGLAFDARLMPVKVLSARGWGSLADVADGIRWAADHGADVINLSLGGPFPSRVLQKAIDYARDRGVVVVAAAGNSGGRVEYPGASRGVIGVSATDSDDKLAWFSSRGPGVDIAAPGVDVTQQTICNGGLGRCETFPRFSGTSMAAPHVAGAAALLVSLGVTEPDAVERILQRSAEPIDTSRNGRKQFGAGLLSASSALERAALRQSLSRLLALSVLIFLVFRWARRRGSRLTPWHPGFLIPAMATGPGLLFFAPFVLPRHLGVVDWLARPLGDWDLLLTASVHGFLPLANVFLPLGLTALLLGVPGMRRLLAGVCLGTSAYLASVVMLGSTYSPVGGALLAGWCVANALACAVLAGLVLAEAKRT